MQKNPAHPEEPEKAYARLQLNGVLDINALADHMSNHNSIYSKGTIVGVITDMCHCIKEAITEGAARAPCPAWMPKATPRPPWRCSPRPTSSRST